jgi:hypothetical protein
MSKLTAEVEEPPKLERVQNLVHDPALVSVDQVIAQLFPAPTLGRLFSTRFRERASREQTILPDEPADIVVACTRSIATLAKELGIGFDTTQKYVTLYKALGLMKKRKVMGKLAFIMGTGIYHPPKCLEANLQHLLKMIKGRHKFRELVSDVLARCKVYGLISQEFQAAAALLQDLLHPQPGETRRTLEQRLRQAGQVFNQVLSSMQNLPKARGQEDAEWFHLSGVVPTKAVESTQTKPSVRHDERHIDGKPPQSAHQVDSYASQTTQEATQISTQGRFQQEVPAQNLPHLPHQVDSAQSQTAEEAIQTATQGRFQQEASASRLPKTPRQVDSLVDSSLKHAAESPHSDQKERREHEHGPSNLPANAHQVDSAVPANVNDIIRNVIDSLNVNVKPVIEYLRFHFREEPRKRGYYYNLYNNNYRQPEAWLAAAIETLVGLHRDKTVTEPGRLFYKQCVAFHQGIPAETAELVRRYGHLSHVELLKALQQPSVGPPVRPPAHQVTRRPSIQRHIPRDKPHPGMSREDLRQVLLLANSDERTCAFLAEPYLQADESCALLIDDQLGHQCWVYSLQEWRDDLSRIQTARDLFSHGKG